MRDRLKLGVGEGFQIVDRMRRALVPAADDMLEGLDSKHYVAELQTLSVEVSGDVCAEAVVVTGVNAALDRRLDARDATVLTWGGVWKRELRGTRFLRPCELQGTLRSASVEVWERAEELVREIIGGLFAA